MASRAAEAYVATRERAVRLDPRSSNVVASLGWALTIVREFDRAEALYRRALDLAPDNSLAHIYRRLNQVMWKGFEAYADPKPELLGGLDYWHYHIALSLERWDDAQAMVDRSPPEGIANVNAFLPVGLFQGWIHALRGEPALAASSFESARLACAAQLAEQPDDDRAETCLGHAHAGLGQREQAIEHGRRAVELVLSGRGLSDGDAPYRKWELARIYAQVGEAELSLETLEEILGGPTGFSVQAMEIDPFFAPLRDHPRYRALLRSAS